MESIEKPPKKEGNESVTICNALKLCTADGKMRLTDVSDTEQLFRLIQSIPPPKAEPFKQWMAHVASERTNAISLQVKAGRYGGTYAHKDVAFEFAIWAL